MELSKEKQDAWNYYRTTRADLIADLQLMKLLKESPPVQGAENHDGLVATVRDRVARSRHLYGMALRLMEQAGE